MPPAEVLEEPLLEPLLLAPPDVDEVVEALVAESPLVGALEL